jgi:hypothetical protein
MHPHGPSPDKDFSEPVLYDWNTAPPNYPWEDAGVGAIHSFSLSNMAVMTDPSQTMVQPQKDGMMEENAVPAATEDQTGAGEGNDPTSADPSGGAVGDGVTQDLGGGEGDYDEVTGTTLEAEDVNLPLVGGVGWITLGVAAVAGWWVWKKYS